MPRGGSFLLCFLLCSLLSCMAAAAAGAAAPVRQGDALSMMLFGAATSSSSQTSAFLSNLKSRVHINPGSKEDDKIAELPGQPQGVEFDQYGGYVTVDGHNGRALFYYFAEAVGGSSSSRAKPLVLWLNGGPGCSSLGYGAMEELGPFRVASDGKTLYRNPYAWNEAANVLFLESPAGVGFSYSNTTSDYAKSGDQRTAEDAFVFLLNWLERFPDYKGRDFYIAGESYAGHYVPQLADEILLYRRRSAGGGSSVINLKGIAIGNAVINEETDNRGMYDYFWTHGLISDDTIEAIHESCNFSSSSFFTQVKRQPARCVQARQEANRVFGELNIYNIYSPLCFSSNVTSTPNKPNSIEDFDPCTDNYVSEYLNDPQVQRALHANVTKVNYTWSACSQVILGWSDSASTILPIIRRLLAKGQRVLVYSGDIDGRVPVTSTRYSLNALNLTVSAPWRSWAYNNEVGGYALMYEKNLTFATVRGAGHEVPSYQPGRALAMIKSFLQGVQLPVSHRRERV